MFHLKDAYTEKNKQPNKKAIRIIENTMLIFKIWKYLARVWDLHYVTHTGKLYLLYLESPSNFKVYAEGEVQQILPTRHSKEMLRKF